MTFYVSNLSPETTRDDLVKAFQAHGGEVSVSLPGERMRGGRAGGAHRGYAFVAMTDRAEATAALAALNGRPFHGLAMSVRVARPKHTPQYPS